MFEPTEYMVKPMEESHEPHLPAISVPAAPPVPPPGTSLQTTATISAPSVKRPGRWLVLRRTMRLLLRRWLYAMTILFRWMRPIAGFLAVIAALLGVIAWMGVQLWWPSADASKDVRVAPLLPAPGVEHYIQGQQTFNAEIMWESLSAEAQVTRLQRGATKDTMQTQANQERQRGIQYLHYDYIGGVKLKDGGTMYFYAVDLDSPQGSGKLPFTFFTDGDGKVRGLVAPEY